MNANTFVNGTLTFVGWNTKRDGTGVHYDEGETVINLVDENGGVFVLYAEWEDKVARIGNNYYDTLGEKIWNLKLNA